MDKKESEENDYSEEGSRIYFVAKALKATVWQNSIVVNKREIRRKVEKEREKERVEEK